MASAIAHITWGAVSGSTGYLVEYRVSNTSTWITPNNEPNPTLSTFYDLTITYNVSYDVKITSSGARCSPSSRTFQVFAPLGACCPPGYTLSIDASYCYKINTTAATPPDSPENTVATPYHTYAAYGTVVYNLGYDPGGFGSFTLIPLSNTFWNNQVGNTIAGPNNRTGLWAAVTAANQDVGFTACVTLPDDGIYYIGCFADNVIKIKLDGVTLVDMNVTNMAAYFEANGYPGIGPFVTFYFWHVYPIALPAGTHVIEIIGHNYSDVAAMGGEIYNASLSDLISAHSYVDLGAKLIFSTKDYIGVPIQIGSGGIGYECPTGYSLVLCDGPAYCKQIITTPTISCTEINPVYYGVNLTGIAPPDSATILAGSVIVVDASLDVSINWQPLTGSPEFCWVAIPNLGLAYQKNHWFVDILNQGHMGNPDDLFGATTTVTVSGTPYLVRITNYETQFIAVCKLQKV